MTIQEAKDYLCTLSKKNGLVIELHEIIGLLDDLQMKLHYKDNQIEMYLKAIADGKNTVIDLKNRKAFLVSEIEELKANQQWITVSEQLPQIENENGRIAVNCIVSNNQVIPLFYCKRKVRNKVVERWELQEGRIYWGIPIAWQPLPKPYESE